MQSTCEQCGVIFTPRKNSKGRFCSHDCHRQWQKSNGRQIKVCPTCKEKFSTYRDPANARTYCSPECRPAKVEKITKVCEGCQKDFKVYPSQSSQVYCTLQCRQDHRCTITKCPNCGKDVRSWKANKHIYCNRECEKAYTVLSKECPKCGKSFTYHRSWPRKYCSLDCSNSANAVKNLGDFSSAGSNHPFWEGGSAGYYGPNWCEQRRKARKRAGHKCECCGKTRKQNGAALDVHHIEPFRSFNYIPDENNHYLDANRMDNLMAVCRSCHRKIEHGKIPVQPRLI